MTSRWEALKARLLPDPALPLEEQFFQELCLLGTLVPPLIIIPINLFEGLPALSWIAELAFAGLCLFLWQRARKGSHHPRTVFFVGMIYLDVCWFTGAGSQGSTGLFFFIAALYGIVFFKDAFRWAALFLIVANVMGLHLAERAWPSLVAPFPRLEDRLLDMSAGYALSLLIAGTMLWVVLRGFRQERMRLRAALGDLRASEQRYRALSEDARDLVYRYRFAPQMGFEYLSPSTFSLTGYTPEELYAEPSRGMAIVHPEDVQKLEQSRQSGVEPDVPLRLRWIRKDGQIIWTEQLFTYLRNAEDRIVAVQGVVRDATTLVEAEEALRKASASVEHSPVVHVVTDLEGTIEYVNAAFTRTTGYLRSEAVGQTARMLKSGSHPQAFYEDLWTTIKQGRTWRGRIHNRRKDGTFYWEQATIAPVRDEQGRLAHFVAAKEDITEALEAEEARRRLEQQVQQAQKISSLGSLAGGVAHDFNNMLAGIMGYSDLLLATETDAKRQEYLRSILSAATRSSDLTRKLLAFGRRGKNRAEPVDVTMAVQECLSMLQPSMNPDLALVPRLQEGLSIDGDPSQIQQVLVNLCLNAVEAMPKGGRLEVSTRLIHLDGAEAEAHRLSPGSYVELEVEDSGPGMDEGLKERIFEPFFTTKTQKGEAGTGLGLSTVYGIVEAHQGVIEVTSAVGLGSTFRVLLPCGQLAKAVANPEPAPGRGSGVILVVEDEPLLREVARAALESLGYTVETAADGRAGVAAFRTLRSQLQAVLLDLRMPVMGGREAFEQLRNIDPAIPVVICTGFGENEEVQAMLRLGAAGMLAKPYRIQQLAEMMHSLQTARA